MSSLTAKAASWKPLCPSFNRVVPKLVEKYIRLPWTPNPEAEVCPETLDGINTNVECAGQILVWSPPPSMKTAFGASYHFQYLQMQALIQWNHWLFQNPTTVQGKRAVNDVIRAQIRETYGGDKPVVHTWCDLAEAETLGIPLYINKWGQEPADRWEFSKAYVEDADRAINTYWGDNKS